MQIAHRRFLAIDDAASGIQETAAAADQQRRQIFVQMAVAIRQTRAVDDDRVIQQIGVAFLGRFQLFEETCQLLSVIFVDLRNLLHQIRLVLVVRTGMVTVRDADFAIGARCAFAGDQERNDARHVGLERDGHHVGEQLEVLGEIRRYAIGLVHPRIHLSVILFGLFELPFHFADGREIFVELALVGRSERRLQLLCIGCDEIQNALPVLRLLGALFGRHGLASAEEAFE